MWISSAKHKELVAKAQRLVELIDNADKELKNALDKTFLVDIQRDGRVNKFTFSRNGEFHIIETMGLLSDDLPEWKKRLLR